MISFSVLMSVYRNDKAECVRMAVESVTIRQTLQPAEVILMVDGPVSVDLKQTINELEKQICYLKPIWLKENVGLGNVLRIGMEYCTNELVARMDADDISLPDRFEKQIEYMFSHPELAVVGGQISEFIDTPTNIVSYRRVPCNSTECRRYYANRDPLNHMSVCLRRSAVLDAGSYQPWHLDEDTFLWGRLLLKGYEIGNLPDILVNVRVGAQMYARRGGYNYFKSDMGILQWKYKNGLMSLLQYYYNYVVRFMVYVMMPNKLRGCFFRLFMRK